MSSSLKILKKIAGSDYKHLYIFYLQSPHPDGDILARAVPFREEDGEVIEYYFGKRELLFAYLQRFPDRIKKVLIASYKTIKSNEFIDLFPENECLLEYEYKEFLEELEFFGYDFLKKIVTSFVAI